MQHPSVAPSILENLHGRISAKNIATAEKGSKVLALVLLMPVSRLSSENCFSYTTIAAFQMEAAGITIEFPCRLQNVLFYSAFLHFLESVTSIWN